MNSVTSIVLGGESGNEETEEDEDDIFVSLENVYVVGTERHGVGHVLHHQKGGESILLGVGFFSRSLRTWFLGTIYFSFSKIQLLQIINFIYLCF